MGRKEGWLLVGVHVRHSGWTSTAAVGSLLTQQHVNPPSTQPSLRELVPKLIAMPLMIALALLLARLMITPLFSALPWMGNLSFCFLSFSCFSYTSHVKCLLYALSMFCYVLFPRTRNKNIEGPLYLFLNVFVLPKFLHFAL